MEIYLLTAGKLDWEENFFVESVTSGMEWN